MNKLGEELEAVRKREAKLKRKCDETQARFQQVQKENKVLNEQLLIARQDLRCLGVHFTPIEYGESRKIEEAVTEEIKRKRRRTVSPE